MAVENYAGIDEGGNEDKAGGGDGIRLAVFIERWALASSCSSRSG